MKKTIFYRPTSKVTCVFLVLLRLAIGWHLFIEGAAKLDTYSIGQTGTSKPFSSRGYLLQSQGPLSPWFRNLAGDPDELLLPLLDGPAGNVPPALEARWKNYVERYTEHYRFDQPLKDQSNDLLKKHLAGLAQWFATGTKEVSKDYPFATVTPSLTTTERISEYRVRLKELNDRINGWNLRFDKDVSKARVAALKADVARLRADLQKDLDEQQARLEEDLDKLLTPSHHSLDEQQLQKIIQAIKSQGYSQEQQVIAELVQAARQSQAAGKSSSSWNAAERQPSELIATYSGDPEFRKAMIKVAKRLVAPPLHVEDTRMLDLADRTVAWGLTLAGLGLLLGCFTRLSCLAGAILLVLFYLALPPLPGLPDNPMAEGKYLFVNKNLIEALALLTLATTASGRWFGFDGLLSLLVPFKFLWPKPQLAQVIEPDQASSTRE